MHLQLTQCFPWYFISYDISVFPTEKYGSKTNTKEAVIYIYSKFLNSGALKKIHLMKIFSSHSGISFFSNLFEYSAKIVHSSIYMKKAIDNFKFRSGNMSFLSATSQFVVSNYAKKGHKNYNTTTAIHNKSYVLQ